MEVTMMEHDAYLELRRRLCGLSVAVTELYRKVAPPTREKWLSTQEVCCISRSGLCRITAIGESSRIPR